MRRIELRTPVSPFRRPWSDRRGTAMVEFALLAPLFLTLILGVLEMGRALDSSTLLTSAVREGGRLASMDYNDSLPNGTTINDKVAADIKNFLAAGGIPSDKVVVTITAAEGETAGQPFNLSDPANNLKLFKITASIPFSDVSSFPSSFMKQRNVSGSLVFRAGRVKLVN